MIDISIAKFQEIVGAEFVHTAPPAITVDGVQPKLIVEPGSAEEVGHVLRIAKEAGFGVIPRGGGTKMNWGSAPHKAELLLSTKRLNRVVEHAWGDLTATVEAGYTVADFQQVLAIHKQRLAVETLWPERATIGGILATNDSGASRIRFGSLRDLITGITVVLADGTIARSGGRVVKNVAGYDLPKLMIGALGTLGVITEATFRLYALPAATQTICFVATSIEAAHKIMLAVLDSSLVTTGLQLSVGSDAAPEIAVRLESHEAHSATPESLANSIIALSRQTEIKQIAATDEVWNKSEAMWKNSDQSLICKVSVLPTQLALICQLISDFAEQRGTRWSIVAQGFGLCALRLDLASAAGAADAVNALRAEIEQSKGSLIVLGCPAKVKPHIDVWGSVGDSLPLMQRVKREFDASGVLNPRRFVGGI